MNEKELYRQKYQAQLDEWKAEAAKFRARAAGAKADAQIEMNRHLKDLDQKMHEAGVRIAELTAASEESWGAVKKSAESTWDGLKAGFKAAAAKFKD